MSTAWTELGSYNQSDVDPFLARVLPVVAAAQRHSVSLTDAYLAQALDRRPLGINPDQVINDQVRPGTPAETVYRRPFITVWSSLKAGTGWEAAVNAGLARLRNTARTDVQLAMRGTLREVGRVDNLIFGYQRVPDAGACKLCQAAAGQRYTVDRLFPIHENCGCGVAIITGPERPNFTGRYDNDKVTTADGLSVAVRQHGELGPVLVDADQHFSQV